MLLKYQFSKLARIKSLAISLAISPVFLSLPAVQITAAETIETTYDVYWAGLRVFTAESAISFEDENYVHAVNMRSRGILRVFVEAEMNFISNGWLAAGRIVPVEYTSDSTWNDNIFARSVAYDENGHGVLTRNIVPEDDDDDGSYREAVPEELAIGPDPLGLLVGITLDNTGALARNGESQVTFTSYDGVRSMQYEATCQMDGDPLSPSARSVYSGEAIRCSLTGQQTGGFWRPGENEEVNTRARRRGARGGRGGGRMARADSDRDEEEREERITSIEIWFAVSDDGKYHLPVRMEIRGTRDLDIYLAETNVTLQPPRVLSSDND